MSDPEFAMKVVTRTCYDGFSGRMFDLFPDQYRSDPKYILAAVEYQDFVPSSDILASLYKKDRSFFIELLCRSTDPLSIYENIPEEIVTGDWRIGLNILLSDYSPAYAVALAENAPASLLEKFMPLLLPTIF